MLHDSRYKEDVEVSAVIRKQGTDSGYVKFIRERTEIGDNVAYTTPLPLDSERFELV